MTTSEKPPYANDWEGLAAVAERLRDDRARGDPAQVNAGNLSQPQANDRARISQALALQWRAIARREPIPSLEAWHVEIRADLDAAAKALAERAKKTPAVIVQLGAVQVRCDVYAEAVAALRWQQQPYRDGMDTPRIIFVHEINQMARAQRAARGNAPITRAAELPPARPLRQASLV